MEKRFVSNLLLSWKVAQRNSKQYFTSLRGSLNSAYVLHSISTTTLQFCQHFHHLQQVVSTMRAYTVTCIPNNTHVLVYAQTNNACVNADGQINIACRLLCADQPYNKEHGYPKKSA